MKLFVFGFGYSALHYAQTRRADYASIAGVARTADKRDALRAKGFDAYALDDAGAQATLEAALARADRLLVSAPPSAEGDPTLAQFAEVLRGATGLRSVAYLSTVGVYGDHDGAWIDETAAAAPSNARSQWRLRAEEGWLRLAGEAGFACHVLRLAGIYGPGRNALANLRAGTARRLVKPGQVFNRIHVEDIARAIDVCLAAQDGSGVWNVSDDEPAPPQDVVAYAATLMGVAPPPETPFAEADLSPMARSFYSECKRVSNAAIKTRLGMTFAYPTYREALDAMWRDGEGR